MSILSSALLRLRLIAAIGMTLGGKGLGVLGPLVLGAAVNHLAAGQGAAGRGGWPAIRCWP